MRFPTFIILIAFSIITLRINAQDQCKDILELAAYNNTKMIKTDSFSSDIKTFFLSDNFRDFVHNQDADFNLGLPPIGDIPPIQIGAQSSDEEIRKFQQHIRAMSDKQFSSLSKIYLIQKIVNKESVKAWHDCMVNRQWTDIEGTIVNDGQYIDLQLRWKQVGPNDKPPVVQSFDFAPLVAKKLRIKPGVKINISGINQRLKRVTPGPVTISLGTTRGSWVKEIEDLPPNPPKPHKKHNLLIKITGTAENNSVYVYGDAAFEETAETVKRGQWFVKPQQVYFECAPGEKSQQICQIVTYEDKVELSIQTDHPVNKTITIETEGGVYQFQHNVHRTLSMPLGSADK